MPVYNQEEFVLQAIDSVLNQTFTDFEFIVVDDGSTDRTPELLASVKDPRFRYILAPHTGFIRSLVRGYEEARGRWIARMDSDDISHPDRLRAQMEFLAVHPECTFLGTNYGVMSPGGRLAAPREEFEWRYVEPAQITLGGRVFGDPTTVFDRTVAAEVGFFDPDFASEIPLWYRLLSRGNGAVLGQVLYYHRWRMESLSRVNIKSSSLAHIAIRQRYDPENARRLGQRTNVDEKVTGVCRARAGIFLYLAAGDRAAARELAFRLWRRWPWTLSVNRLLLQATLGVEHFRIWQKKMPDLVRVDPKQLHSENGSGCTPTEILVARVKA